MNVINFFVRLWHDHGTKLLGYASGIVSGFITIPGLIAGGHVKYWSAASVVLAALTVGRGYVNSANLSK
jgi:hypothetical protein